MIRNASRLLGLTLLLTLTWAITVLHLGVYPRPNVPELGTSPPKAQWIDKSRFGMHQMILSGSPYERGVAAGKFTTPLLQKQERVLVDKLQQIVPNRLALDAMIVGMIRWFWGIERYLEPWMVEEMYGVSLSAPREFDFLADGLSRQVAYHGLHEVGQMMVDQGGEDMGCTVAAVPFQDTWILGRNFDFEGGRVFDTEKIVKWVFPEQGYALVSVIWAGMVGAVTGVNEHGLYLSLNAAGSTDFRRHGTPSTLVLLKALQFSKNADEALEILKRETMFITDIFVLLDSKAGKLYRIEKSPGRTVVLPVTTPLLVANHLVSPEWNGDRINEFRKTELTSGYREARGKELLERFSRELTPALARDARHHENAVLAVLRDKGQADAQALGLGNRRAIDALIATHAVVFNGADQTLYVSQGPALAGAFTGFDLQASFKAKAPVARGTLPRDPLVSNTIFEQLKASAHDVSVAQKRLKKGDCQGALPLLEKAGAVYQQQSAYETALGDYARCRGDAGQARIHWQRALKLHPAYAAEARDLERKLESGK